MSAFVLIQGHDESGNLLPAEIHEWHTATSADMVREIYQRRYPDKVWKDGTMYRDRYTHTLHGRCILDHIEVTFHDTHPTKGLTHEA